MKILLRALITFCNPKHILFFITSSILFTNPTDAQLNYYSEWNGKLSLTQTGASHFANLALDCIHKEYPNKLGQVLANDSQLMPPRDLYPCFYGCFDWHSAVHGHWMLVRLLKMYPDLPESKMIREKLAHNFTPQKLKGEVSHFENASKSWERMYGWSWMMKLAEELYSWDDEEGKQWYTHVAPLAKVIGDRYMEFLPVQDVPVRTGVHPNTAFGLSFALDYARTVGWKELEDLILDRAIYYFQNDQNCPTFWEPSGEDFLSGCLEEANLMSRVLTPREFEKWFKNFIPPKAMKYLRKPADVSDRSDPKIVHLDGLNLSRAWSFYQIQGVLLNKKKKKMLQEAAQKHLDATLPNIAAEHYEGGHWLASFAVYALSSSN